MFLVYSGRIWGWGCFGSFKIIFHRGVKSFFVICPSVPLTLSIHKKEKNLLEINLGMRATLGLNKTQFI